MSTRGTGVTIRAILNRPLPNLAEISSHVDTLIKEIQRVFGSEPWVSVTGGTWGEDAEANARLLLRAPEDPFGPAWDLGLAPALTAGLFTGEAMLTVTAAPIVGEHAPLNQASLRIVTGPEKALGLNTLNTLMQMMAVAFGPVAAVYLTSPAVSVARPQDPWATPVGYAVWLPVQPAQLNLDHTTLRSFAAVNGTILYASPSLGAEQIHDQFQVIYTRHGITQIPH